jgi:hypothetical protein
MHAICRFRLDIERVSVLMVMSSNDPVEPAPRRIPAGVMMSSTRHEPRHRRAEVLCTDQGWRPAEILAWARCQAGWAALIRWPDGTQDWRQHDRRLIRPV